MCCLFTCLAWFLDFMQQTWTFLMSFCVMAALCCLFLVASSAGVVMGYNYSLSEFIDTKETNVSVHMKRGIFETDSSLEEDLSWRRSGNQPAPANAFKMTQATIQSRRAEPPDVKQPDIEQPIISRRAGRIPPIHKIEDSIFETDDRHQFEGSLLKLTAKPVDAGTINLATQTPYDTRNEDRSQVLMQMGPGSMENLKGVQSFINRKRINALTRSKQKTPTSTYVPVEKYINPDFIGNAQPVVPEGGRRMMEASNTESEAIEAEKITQPNIYNRPTKGESLRDYVPEKGIGDPAKWFLPKLPPEVHDEMMGSKFRDEPLNARPTFPPPVTPRHGPLRPSRYRPKPTATTTSTETLSTKTSTAGEDFVKPYANQVNFGNPLMFDKMDPNVEDIKKNVKDYYDDDIKGLPVRRRRNVDSDKNSLSDKQFIVPIGIDHLERKYTTNTIETNNEPIVTVKVIVANIQISNPITFLQKVKKTTELNKNKVKLNSSSAMSSLAIVKRKTTAPSILLPMLNNALQKYNMLTLNNELDNLDLRQSTMSKFYSASDLMLKIIKSTIV